MLIVVHKLVSTFPELFCGWHKHLQESHCQIKNFAISDRLRLCKATDSQQHKVFLACMYCVSGYFKQESNKKIGDSHFKHYTLKRTTVSSAVIVEILRSFSAEDSSTDNLLHMNTNKPLKKLHTTETKWRKQIYKLANKRKE